jgi:divalent metal cation (Fe/Co/Zn/Cd) transporter
VELADKVRGVASQILEIKGIHEIALHSAEKGFHLELHVEVDPRSTLEEAHAVVTRLESAIKEKLLEITEVATHIESTKEKPLDYEDRTLENEQIVRSIRQIATDSSGVRRCNDISVHTDEQGLRLTLTCMVVSNLSVSEAHEIATRVEETLRKRIKGVSGVLVHMEPDLH